METPAESPWREELSERVQKFRRRRARSLRSFDPSTQLAIDFEAATPKREPAVGVRAIESCPNPRALDVELGSTPGSAGGLPPVESVSLEKKGSGLRVLSRAAVQAGEIPLDDRALKPPPVAIVLESPRRSATAAGLRASGLILPPAPLGRRFLAGVVDTAVLLLAAVLFASVFWLAGGRISLRPVNIAVLAFIAIFILLLYFELFTALTASTLGLLSMGLEVRRLDGNLPTPRDSFRRAFGYLVSVAALMLGFIWALVDSERLTWHDRMSGTFVTASGLRIRD